MTNYKQRDIVLVKFSFSEGIGFKKRPALVLSSAEYHRGRQEIILAAITSNVDRILAGDTKIVDWKAANLISASLVTGILQTLKNDLIERRLGSLSDGDFQQVKGNLKISLNL